MMLAAVAAASAAMAQGNGQAGITEATQLVTGYFDPGTKLIYAIGAVIGMFMLALLKKPLNKEIKKVK